MMGVPTFYTRLLDDARFDRALAGHMRLFISGSAPLLAETHAAWQTRTGHRILERYGMTETNMNTSNPYDGDRRAGTVGFHRPRDLDQLIDRYVATHTDQIKRRLLPIALDVLHRHREADGLGQVARDRARLRRHERLRAAKDLMPSARNRVLRRRGKRQRHIAAEYLQFNPDGTIQQVKRTTEGVARLSTK